MSLEPQRAGPKADSPEVAEPATGASTSAKSTDWRHNALTVLEALAKAACLFLVWRPLDLTSKCGATSRKYEHGGRNRNHE
jgi:hypothetical protein